MISKEVYILPERWRLLSGSWLKVIAMVSMAIDHLAAYLFRYDPDFTTALFTVGSKQVSWYFLMRCIGRLAFPLFAFLLVEGFLHTSNRMKYGRNLLVFALLSEIPYDLVRRGSLFAAGQNVFFTLFLGFLALYAVDRWESGKDSAVRLAVILFSLIGVGILFHTDYGSTGVGFILLLYVFRQHRVFQAAIGWCYLPMRWVAGLAFVPINLYNGRRGFIQGPIGKYLFYVFYPLHLLVIYLLRRMMMNFTAMKRILLILVACVLAMNVNAANDKKVLRLPCTVEPLQLSIAPKDLNANQTYRQLVVLVSFSDCDFSMEDPKATYDAMFNQNGYNQRDGAGCIADYFRDQSNGLFNLQFDVYGPIKVNRKVQAGSGSSADFRSGVFAEAMRALTTQQPDINYSPYDWNGDGYVNQVIFVYAGYAGNQPGFTTYIWPSTGTMNSTVTTPDGYKIYSYSSSGELWSNNTSCGIGTICHEFSHCLGLPDIYPTNTNDSSLPISIVDEWDLMDGGHGSNLGWCPPNYSALEKMLLGWLTPTELTTDTVITGMKPVSDGGEVYLIRHTENEYYLLENRQWQGWDVSVPGHGLLVWHVNYNASKWSNNVVNNTAGKPNYHLVTADNLDYDAWLDLYYERGGGNPYQDKSRQLHRCLLSSAPYPWATDSTDFVNNELTNTSTPAAIMYNKNATGSTLLSKPITDITEHEDGTISFVFHASTPDGMITINREPLTNNHIYTLTGRKVQAEAINSLPKGFYIINGKKMIIR